MITTFTVQRDLRHHRSREGFERTTVDTAFGAETAKGCCYGAVWAVIIGPGGERGIAMKPLLLLDIDGVLNPFPRTPAGYCEYDLFPGDDEPVRLSPSHAQWLRELLGTFEIVWASAWGERANELICPILGLPAFHFIAFPPVPFEPREKVPAVAAFAGHRPVAWVEDVVTDEARTWAAERTAPTLLIEVSSAAGLTREAVENLRAWQRTVSSQGASSSRA